MCKRKNLQAVSIFPVQVLCLCLQFLSFSKLIYNLHPCYVLCFLISVNERISFELNTLNFQNTYGIRSKQKEKLSIWIIKFSKTCSREESFVVNFSSTFPCLLLLKPRFGVYVGVYVLTVSMILGFIQDFKRT